MSEEAKNRVHRFVSNDFSARASFVDATQVVQEMQALQKSKMLATIGVGRAMVGALLMSSHLKDGQSVGLLFKGNGPLGSIYAEASYEGEVRGYCPCPEFEANKSEDLLSLGKALGFGSMTVARHQPYQRQPFLGTVEMASGEIGEDIAHYLHQSQQIRSLVRLGVFVDVYGLPKAAGGVLIEVMPGVEDDLVKKLQINFDEVKTPISKMILDGASAAEILSPLIKEIPFTEIPHQFPVKYSCPCTADRVKRALTTLGIKDLAEIIKEEKQQEITCQVCGRKYTIGTSELMDLLDDLKRNQLH